MLLIKQGILSALKSKMQTFILIMLIILNTLLISSSWSTVNRLTTSNDEIGFGTVDYDYKFNYISTNYEANNQQTITPWFAFDVDYASIGSNDQKTTYATATIGGPNDALLPFDISLNGDLKLGIQTNQSTNVKRLVFSRVVSPKNLNLPTGVGTYENYFTYDKNVDRFIDVENMSFLPFYKFNSNSLNFQNSLIGKLYSNYINNPNVSVVDFEKASTYIHNYMHILSMSRLTSTLFESIEDFVFTAKLDSLNLDNDVDQQKLVKAINRFVNGDTLGDHWQTKNLGSPIPNDNVATVGQIFPGIEGSYTDFDSFTNDPANKNRWGLRGNFGQIVFDDQNKYNAALVNDLFANKIFDLGQIDLKIDEIKQVIQEYENNPNSTTTIRNFIAIATKFLDRIHAVDSSQSQLTTTNITNYNFEVDWSNMNLIINDRNGNEYTYKFSLLDSSAISTAYHYLLVNPNSNYSTIQKQMNSNDDYSNVYGDFLTTGSWKVRNIALTDILQQTDYDGFKNDANQQFLDAYLGMIGLISNYNTEIRNQVVLWTREGKKFKFVDWTQPKLTNQLKIYQHNQEYDTVGLKDMWSTIIVTPQFARDNKLSVKGTSQPLLAIGDVELYINATGGDTLNIYPTIYDTDVLPDSKQESIIYTSPTAMSKLFGPSGIYSDVDPFSTSEYQDVSEVYLSYVGVDQSQKGLQKNVFETYLADNNNKLDDFTNALLRSDVVEKAGLDIINYFGNTITNNRYSLLEKVANIFRNSAIWVSLFLIVIISIVIFIQLKSMLDKQRSQIGILKANGYSNFKIALSYVFYFLTSSLIGVPIGWGLGLILQIPLVYLFSSYFVLIAKFQVGWEALLFSLAFFTCLIFIVVSSICFKLLGRDVLGLLNSNRDFKPNQLISKITKKMTKASFNTRFRFVLLGASWKSVLIFMFTAFIATGTITLSALAPSYIKVLSNEYYANVNYENEVNYQNVIFNNPIARYNTYELSSGEFSPYQPVHEDENGVTQYDSIISKLDNYPIAPAVRIDDQIKTLKDLASTSDYVSIVTNMLVHNFSTFKGTNISLGLMRYLYELPQNNDIKNKVDSTLTLLTCTMVPQLFGQTPISNPNSLGNNWEKWSQCLSQATNTLLPSEIKQRWDSIDENGEKTYQLRFNIGFNSISIDHSTDDLYTGYTTLVNTLNGVRQDSSIMNFNTYGINKTNTMVGIEDSLKNAIFQDANENTKTIPVAINSRINVRYGINVGDEISLYTNTPRLQYLDKDGSYKDIKHDWWFYDENDNDVYDPNVDYDIWNLDLSKFTNSPMDRNSDNDYQFLDEQGNYHPYYQMEKIKLAIPEANLDPSIWNRNKVNVNAPAGATETSLLNTANDAINEVNNQWIIHPYGFKFEHQIKSLWDLSSGSFPKTWFNVATSQGLIKVTGVNDKTLSPYKYKIVGIQDSYDEDRVFLSKHNADLVLGYTNSDQWFNGKYTTSTDLADQFQHFVFSSTDGDNSLNSGFSKIHSGLGLVDYVGTKKHVIFKLAETIMWVAIALVSIVIVAAAIIISLITDVFMDKYTKFIALMRVFGYRKREVNSLTLSIFVPFALIGWGLGFFVICGVAYLTIYKILHSLALPLSIPFPWLILGLIFILVCLIFTLTFSISTIKTNKLKIQTIVTLSDE